MLLLFSAPSTAQNTDNSFLQPGEKLLVRGLFCSNLDHLKAVVTSLTSTSDREKAEVRASLVGARAGDKPCFEGRLEVTVVAEHDHVNGIRTNGGQTTRYLLEMRDSAGRTIFAMSPKPVRFRA
ncbi:hypothetical protein K8Q93_02950 [Candidatus Parcubacteria bacterium]|nr:hypothetical protein [Candidatus Parcubacteria bacterium]